MRAFAKGTAAEEKQPGSSLDNNIRFGPESFNEEDSDDELAEPENLRKAIESVAAGTFERSTIANSTLSSPHGAGGIDDYKSNDIPNLAIKELPAHDATFFQYQNILKPQHNARMPRRPLSPSSYPDTESSISPAHSSYAQSQTQSAKKQIDQTGQHSSHSHANTRRAPDTTSASADTGNNADWSNQSVGHQSNSMTESTLPGAREVQLPRQLNVKRNRDVDPSQGNPAKIHEPHLPAQSSGLAFAQNPKHAFDSLRKNLGSRGIIRPKSVSQEPDRTALPTQSGRDPNVAAPLPKNILFGEDGAASDPVRDVRETVHRGAPYMIKPDDSSAPTTNTAEDLHMTPALGAYKVQSLHEVSEPESQSSPESAAEKLDYPHERLITMDFSKLQSECFDRPEMPPGSPAPFMGDSGEELSRALEAALTSGDEDERKRFVSTLNIDQWEAAGRWFVTKQGALFERMLALRREKRAIARRYESLIGERHGRVVQRMALIEERRSGLKKAGGAVLAVGSPQKRKEMMPRSHDGQREAMIAKQGSVQDQTQEVKGEGMAESPADNELGDASADCARDGSS